MPESVEKVEGEVWTSDDSVPDYVRESISEAIDGGAVFDRIESVEQEVGERFHDIREQIEDLLEENLTQPQGWSLESVRDDLRDSFPNMSEGQAETVARSETASVLNTAREEGYEDRDDSHEYFYKWVGPDDSRTTDACERLKALTNPDHGGTPVGMEDLKRLERKIANEEFPELEWREHMLHINERHTFRRVLPHELNRLDDVEGNVSMSTSVETDRDSADTHEHITMNDYLGLVEKMGAVLKDRTRREREVEEATGEPLPRLLNRLLGEHGGGKRPAMRALNDLLDDAGMNQKVSSATFYNWVADYRLDDRDYSGLGS